MGSRKKLIKTTLPALFCVMALLLAACGGSSTAGLHHESSTKQTGVYHS